MESCFETLFSRMRMIAFSGCLVHNLIIRQAESYNTHVMEFNINGKGAIFTKKEFGIITGLKMDESLASPPPYSDRLVKYYFPGKKRITMGDFHKVFPNLKFSDCEKTLDMVKLSLLYFLSCGILAKESQSSIDLELFSMVEDLDYFNQYAWGLESYKATIVSLHKVLKLHNGQLNTSNTYSLCGFPIAF